MADAATTASPEEVKVAMDVTVDMAKTKVDEFVNELEEAVKPVAEVPLLVDEREAAGALGGDDGSEAQVEAQRASLAGAGASSYSAKAFAPPGTPVLTTRGTGVILSYNEAEDSHRVRIGAPRGADAADAYLARSSMVRILDAAVGFAVRTPKGRGKVIEFRPAANPRPYSGPPKLKTLAAIEAAEKEAAAAKAKAAGEGEGEAAAAVEDEKKEEVT